MGGDWMWIESGVFAFVTVESSGQFFRSIILWLVGVSVVSSLIRWLASKPWGKPGARAAEPLDAYAAAYLAGGYQRLADAAMAGLFRAGQIELIKPRKLKRVGGRSDEASTITKAVLDIAAASGTVNDARRAVRFVASGAWRDALVGRGLVLSRAQQKRAKYCSALPWTIFLLMLIGRLYVGWDRGEDVRGVFGVSVVVVIFMFWFLLNAPRTTGLGRTERKRLKIQHRGTSYVHVQSAADWAWVCGLFGVMALPSGQAKELQAGLRPGDGASRGGDAEDGSSGCSGCGGCGGCGD